MKARKASRTPPPPRLPSRILDLGTPSTTEFTLPNNGAATNAYPTNAVAWIRVTDLDMNTNATTIDTVTVTVTDNVTGDSQTMTLYETGVDTGVFTNSIPTTTNSVAVPNDGVMQAPSGSILTASYTDPTDPPIRAAPRRLSSSPPGSRARLAIYKTVVSPTGGQVFPARR